MATNIPSGTINPSAPAVGDLFLRLDLNQILVFSDHGWLTTANNADLNAHATDPSLHLSSAENTFLGAVNFVDRAPTQLAGDLNSLSSHYNNNTRHLTPAQNQFFNTLTVGSTQLNLLTGIDAYLASISVPSLGIALANLSNGKVSTAGDTMLGTLTMSRGATITGVPAPVNPSDVVNKEYVDVYVQGVHWTSSVKAATVQEITLAGIQVIDDVVLASGNRVLVKNQPVEAENGIYQMSSGAWSRAIDYDTPAKMNQSATFIEPGGTVNGRSSFVQTKKIINIGTDPISFSQFTGPSVSSGGNGISLSSNGVISINSKAGLKFDAGALAVDLSVGGGLMTTIDNTEVSTDDAAKLAIAPIGTPGTYRSVTTNRAGQVIAGTNPTTLSGYGITDAVNKTGDTISGALSFSSGFSISNTTPVNAASWVSTQAYGTNQGDNKTHFGFNDSGIWTNFIRGDRTQINGTLDVYDDVKFTKSLRVGTGPAVGFVTLGAGDSSKTGEIKFMTGEGVQRASITSSNQTIIIGAQAGWKWSFASTPQVGTSDMLHAGNISNFAPALNGTGATGTWGISVTGSAGSASVAPWAGISGKPTLSNWVGIDSLGVVVGQLGWKSHGNGGSVFDASAGTAPNASAIDPINAATPWSPSAPNLMGWDGTGTVGVRVDSARTSSITEQRVFSNVKTNGADRGLYGTVEISGTKGGLAGIDFKDVEATFALDAHISGVYRNAGWDWAWTDGVLTAGQIPAARIVGSLPASDSASVAGMLKNGGTGAPMTFNYVSQSGQPNYVWGTNAVNESHLYNTAGFRVAYADVAGTSSNTQSISAAVNADYVWTKTQQFRTNKGAGSYLANNSSYGLQAYSSDGGAAALSFHRAGLFGLNMGLDPDNIFRIGGWSAAQNLFQMDMDGNVTIRGSLTETSDRRVKTDITKIESALHKLEDLNGVTYTRTDTGAKGTGLIAQDVLAVLPEAVKENEDGMLSVAYGNLVGLLVEAIKELNTEVKSLRAQLNAGF